LLSKNFFGIKLFSLFCKLDHFIAMEQIWLMFIKCYSLQKNVSKFMPD